MVKIGLIAENAKELDDFFTILNNLNLILPIKVYVIYLADIYKDKNQDNLFDKINFEYEIFRVKNPYNKSFRKYSLIEKIKLVKQNIKSMFDFIKKCKIFLCGTQVVFQRVLYCKIKKNKLPIKIISYHRHLLFSNPINEKYSKILHNKIIYKLLSILNLDGLLIKVKLVGFADKYLVLGGVNKFYLMHNGIDENDIISVGSLELDEKIILNNNLEKLSPKICYITTAFEHHGQLDNEKYQKQKIENLLYHCQKQNIIDITIRIHPRENFEKYELLKARYDFLNLQYPSNNKLLHDLKEFDVLIGGVSTALFEVMNQKKVIFYILEQEKNLYQNLIDNFSLPYITELSNFKQQIDKYKIADKSRFIKYDPNEKAIDRIVNILKNELKC